MPPIESRPVDSKLTGELYPGVDYHDRSVAQFDLTAVGDASGSPVGKLATLVIQTGAGMMANGAAIMGMVIGLPQHNCPHCHEVIEAQGGVMDRVIANETAILAEREAKWTGVKPDEGPRIITGDEVVADLAMRRARKLTS